MSGAFWNFGSDYTQNSALTKLLNKAFIPLDESLNLEKKNDTSKDSDQKDDIDQDINEEEDEDVVQIDNDEDFKNFKPNLDILDNLLKNEDVYTELMCSNFKLLGYLKYPEVLDKLIDFVTDKYILDFKEDPEQNGHIIKNDELVEEDDVNQDDDMEIDDEERESEIDDNDPEKTIEFIRGRKAAEILSTEIWSISSTLLQNDNLLNKLWATLKYPNKISMVASTYFMKIIDRLLDMDLQFMINYILQQDNLVDIFIKHIQNPILMDFLPKIITTDTPESPNGIINFLNSQDLIPKLVDCLDLEKSSLTIGDDFPSVSAAADFIKAIITISGNSDNDLVSIIGPNELIRKLASPSVMEQLIKIMLKGGISLNNGISIIIELIRKNNSDYDYVNLTSTTLEANPPNDRDPIYLGHMLKLFIKYMNNFKELLISKKTSSLKTSFDDSIEPLGFERFKICELIAELLHCSNMALMNDPKAEIIVKERDTVRIQTLNTNNENKINTAAVEKASNISSQTDNDLSYQMDVLDLQTSQGNDKNSEHPALIGDYLKRSLESTSILPIIIQMFHQFPWNNFLHNVVFDIIQQLLNGPLETGYNKNIIFHLFVNEKLAPNIVAWDDETRIYAEKNGLGMGYQGYLNLIAEEIVKFVSYVNEVNLNNEEINPVLNELMKEYWIHFTETRLATAKENYNTPLGNFSEDQLHSTDDIKLIDDSDEIDDGYDDDNDQELSDDPQDLIDSSDLLNDKDVEGIDLSLEGMNSESYYEYTDIQGHKTSIDLNIPDSDIIEGEDEKSKDQSDLVDDQIDDLSKDQTDLNAEKESMDNDESLNLPASIVPLRANPTDPKLSTNIVVQKEFHTSTNDSDSESSGTVLDDCESDELSDDIHNEGIKRYNESAEEQSNISESNSTNVFSVSPTKSEHEDTTVDNEEQDQIMEDVPVIEGNNTNTYPMHDEGSPNGNFSWNDNASSHSIHEVVR